MLAIGNDRQFAEFCRAAGHPEWSTDPRYATNPQRVAHRGELVPKLAQATRTRSTREWIAALEPLGVPCGPINNVAEVFDDPQVAARGLRVETPSGLGSRARRSRARSTASWST